MKETIQEAQYDFPYHYIPGMAQPHPRARYLSWGLEYIVYQQAIAQELERHTCIQRVLEVGCGDGSFLNRYCRAQTKMGCDLSHRAIRHAAAFASDSTTYHSSPAIDISGSFDAVVAIEVLEHIADREEAAFLRGLADRVSDDGLLVVMVPSTIRPVHKKHYRHYSEDSLRRALTGALPDWSIVAVRGIYSETTLERWYFRLTMNKLWVISISIIERFFLKQKLKNAHVRVDRAAHLMIIAKRTRR
jgi:SAM-dependent methyltransferase